MAKGKKAQNIPMGAIVGGIAGILIISAFVLLFIFAPDIPQTILGGGEPEILDFCSTETECIDFLKAQGMPDNFLEENNIQISCNNGECKAE